jgi:hypothetical protein
VIDASTRSKVISGATPNSGTGEVTEINEQGATNFRRSRLLAFLYI